MKELFGFSQWRKSPSGKDLIEMFVSMDISWRQNWLLCLIGTQPACYSILSGKWKELEDMPLFAPSFCNRRTMLATRTIVNTARLFPPLDLLLAQMTRHSAVTSRPLVMTSLFGVDIRGAVTLSTLAEGVSSCAKSCRIV